jgi:hypothetical protein
MTNKLRMLLPLLTTLAIACGQAKNDPETALAALMESLEKQRWELLYDILPETEQAEWDARIEGMLAANVEERRLAEELAAAGLRTASPEDLLTVLNLSKEQWAALPQREKFARMFGLNPKINFGELGLNPDFVLGATVRSSVTRGDRAEIVVDDGKGHRTKLTFKLQGEYWRFQLGGES